MSTLKNVNLGDFYPNFLPNHFLESILDSVKKNLIILNNRKRLLLYYQFHIHKNILNSYKNNSLYFILSSISGCNYSLPRTLNSVLLQSDHLFSSSRNNSIFWDPPYFDTLLDKFSALFHICKGDQEISNGNLSLFLRHLGPR